MRRVASGIVGALLVLAAAAATLTWPSASEATGERTLEEVARDAISDDPQVAAAAIADLRRRGPEGHAALLRAHASDVAALREGRADFPHASRLRRAVDRVSAQRDGHASGLYWHTDLESAKQAARASGRPILSLRLLGRLDEELSCANSRLFRVLLYSDPSVASRLRERFVLHWSSERPAPRITIDMGDGRRVVRTITGNSIHYVLDAEARPLDGIAGLYAPRAFLAALDEAEQLFVECRGMEEGAAAACLAREHARARATLRDRWNALASAAGTPTYDAALTSLRRPTADLDAPAARLAMPLTVSKALIETPMLRGLGLDAAGEAPTRREPPFGAMGALLYGAASMSATGRALLRLKLGTDDVDAVQATLMSDALADGARNELLFRHRVHELFEEMTPQTRELEPMNAWVYRELMLTPASDPWLGLAPGEGRWDAIER